MTEIKRGSALSLPVTAYLDDPDVPQSLDGYTVTAYARMVDRPTRLVPLNVSILDVEGGRFTLSTRMLDLPAGDAEIVARYVHGDYVVENICGFVTVRDRVEDRIDRIITQYRESPRLLATARALMEQVEAVTVASEALPSFFHIDSASGDQLTMLGLRLGWPRCHCICTATPVFGFDCAGEQVVGFCDPLSTWEACEDAGVGEICINDDATYRQFLKVRIYQILGQFEIASLRTAARIIWPDAWIPAARSGEVVVAPNVEGIDQADPLLQLWARVLPVALGVRLRYHFGTGPMFGFGDGWAGLADCAEPVDLTTESADPITTEGGDTIQAEVPAILGVGEWLCPTNPTPC